MAIANTVRETLTQHALSYRLVEHPRTGSSKETSAAAQVADDHIAKAVIFKDRQGFLMAIVPANAWVSQHALAQELNRPLELATEQEINPLFADCEPGAIPPLGPAYGLETVFDEGLRSLATVYFEAGDHRHLVGLKGDDFCQLLGGCRHSYFGRE